MTAVDLSITFTFGLISSLHCIQMCGPVVLAYSMSLPGRSALKLMPAHLAYNAGRILTYTALGALAGVTGKSLGMAGQLAGIKNLTMIIAGLLMLLAGLFMLDLISIDRLRRFNLLEITSSFLRPLGKRISSPTTGSKFVLGLMLGFLPCGLIYAALIKSMSTGTAVAGALSMTAFGLGTAGALLMIGLFSSVISRKISRWGSRAAAVSVLLLGIYLILLGVMPLIKTASASGGSVSQCHLQ